MSSRNAPRWPRRASATSSASGRVDQATASVVARSGMESSCVTNRMQQRGKGSRWPVRPSVEPGQVARLGYRSAVLWLFARRGFRRLRRRHLPAAGLAFVLLLEPFLLRREVLEHRRAVDLLAAGELLHRLLPRRSAEHTSDLKSLLRISYAVFCLKTKKKNTYNETQELRNKNTNKTS